MYHAVSQSLQAHTPTDAKEAHDVEFILARLNDPVSLFGTANATGHLTGSAFVMDENNRVLFTHHRKLGRWLQLGGHSESFERCLSHTALREAKEESGLTDLVFHPKVSPRLLDVDVHQIPQRRDIASHWHLDLRYAFLTCMPSQIVVSSESNRLKWFTLDEALELEIDASLARALSKLPS